MQREIVLDTETTGLDHRKGDRVIEIGCVELVNRIPTGQEFHHYINPEGRDVHPDAQAVHGISMDMLRDKPVFRKIAPKFVEFIGNAPLVIHNAAFDIGFLNSELQRLQHPIIGGDRIVDTLALARRKHPAGPNSLDALCKRYSIDNSKRTVHGALLDSWLLAEVYLELLGERQATLSLAQGGTQARGTASAVSAAVRTRPRQLATRLSEADVAAHRTFVETLGADAIWRLFDNGAAPDTGSGEKS